MVRDGAKVRGVVDGEVDVDEFVYRQNERTHRRLPHSPKLERQNEGLSFYRIFRVCLELRIIALGYKTRQWQTRFVIKERNSIGR